MNNKNILTAIMIAASGLVNAQVGINTNDPKTTLHVVGTNDNGAVTAADGVLVPRVNDLTTDGAEDGQLVYLINDIAGSYEKGFHFWNVDTTTPTNSAWTPISDNTAIAGLADVRLVGSNNHITSDAGLAGNGLSLGTGSNNIAFGNEAGKNANIESSNISLGTQVFEGVAPLTTNISDGSAVPAGNQTIDRNVALGFQAFEGTKILDDNMAIGSYAGARGDIADQTILIGWSAGSYTSAGGTSTIGGRSLMIGAASGLSSNVGARTLSIGVDAAAFSNGNDDNIFIGTNAGRASTSSDKNILIGLNASFNEEFNSNNIMIGADLDFATTGSGVEASNQLNIQNAIFGTGNSGTGTTVPATGRIGIGEPAPDERLDVAGTAKANNYRQNIEATTTIDKTKGIILANANLSLPNPADYTGLIITIRNVGSTLITFNGGGQTVNGVTTNTRGIPVGNTFRFTSDGSAWYIIGQL